MENPGNNSGEAVINFSVDQLLENLPIGSVSRAIGENMYGINFRQTGNAVPRSKDMYGFTFFTKPQLNLSSINITNFRGFYNLLTSNKLSYQMFTRLTLDPRLSRGGNAMSCPFVDSYNPFIPILTNNIESLSGWPDMTIPTNTTERGLYGQEMSYVDGVTNHYESFDLDVSFKNTRGNPLIYFFYVWIKYATLVYEGVLNPYFDMITEKEYDYNTRIYRVLLDQQKRYVTYIASTGASFPLNIPIGNLFDYNIDTPYNTKNQSINIRFKSMGFITFEDLLKLKFNETTAIFNPDIAKLLEYDLTDGDKDDQTREDPNKLYSIPGGAYVKVPHFLAMNSDSTFSGNPFYGLKHKCLPYINLRTNELEWWTPEDTFKAKSKPLGQTDSSNNDDEYGD